MRKHQSPALFVLLLPLVGPAVTAGDWPQYGGPDRGGVAHETGRLRRWPEGGPPLLWKASGLGTGYSPVSVVGTGLYTLAYRGEDELVVALDRGTGKELWATSLGAARESHAMAFLRQRQPLVDGDRLYAFTTQGHLVCLDAEQGKDLWRKKYAEDFQGRSSPFGWTDYPLVDGEKLVCTPGGKETFHVALDRKTGKVLWKSALPEGLSPSHSPLVAAEVAGVRQYVQNLGGGLVGVSAKDGQLWKTATSCPSATSRRTTGGPRKPVPPMTRIRMAAPLLPLRKVPGPRLHLLWPTVPVLRGQLHQSHVPPGLHLGISPPPFIATRAGGKRGPGCPAGPSSRGSEPSRFPPLVDGPVRRIAGAAC